MEFRLKKQKQLKARRKSERRFSVYIVQCRDGSYYTGLALDVKQRVAKHNRGQGAKYTASHKPVTLVFQERCGDLSEAMRRERRIKSLTRAGKAGLIRLGRRRRRT